MTDGRGIGSELCVANLQIPTGTFHEQSSGLHGRQVSAASDKRDLVAGAREFRAEISADGARTHYRDTHVFAPIVRRL
jgi:hypothetical protein